MNRDMSFYYLMNKEKDPAEIIVFKFVNGSGKTCTYKKSGDEVYAYTKNWAEIIQHSLSISLNENIKIIKDKKRSGKS
jgi:hypothetical protein